MASNKSDDDREVESDSEVEDDDLTSSRRDGPDYMTKRAHHNAKEKKRRYQLKDSFTSLRDCIPTLAFEKSSQAKILKKASDYIDLMNRKIQCHQQDIDLLVQQNDVLGQQVKIIQKNFAAMSGETHDDNFLGDEGEEEGDEEGEEEGDEEGEEEGDEEGEEEGDEEGEEEGDEEGEEEGDEEGEEEGDEEGEEEGDEREEESEEEEVVRDTRAVPQAQPNRKKLRRF